MSPKTYLNVSYVEKDIAKKLGARWDPAAKKWYVPAGVDIVPFLRFMNVRLTREVAAVLREMR
jgi:hypothetical protein